MVDRLVLMISEKHPTLMNGRCWEFSRSEITNENNGLEVVFLFAADQSQIIQSLDGTCTVKTTAVQATLRAR